MQLMGKVVANLDNVTAVVPMLESLGKTHAHFKVGRPVTSTSPP
jgi:hypothetical protein